MPKSSRQGTNLISEKIYIPIITKATESHFWNAIGQGAQQAAECYGVQVSLDGMKRGAASEEQLQLLRNVLDKNPQAFIFSAVDSKAAIPYLEEAQSKNTPI